MEGVAHVLPPAGAETPGSGVVVISTKVGSSFEDRCALPCSPKVYPVEEVPPSPTFGFYMGSLHGKWATSCPAVGWGNRVQSQLLASQRRRCGRSAPCIEDEPLILRVTESGGQGGETMVEGA